jgi:general secretion pathway protein D
LIVKAKQEDIDLIAAWLAATSEARVDRMRPSGPHPRRCAIAAGPEAAVQRKLDTIVIPKIEFRLATVREAVDFLKRKSVELDAAEPDQNKRGISVVLKGPPPAAGGKARPSVPSIPGLDSAPPAASDGDGDAFSTKVTLSLSNIPLGEAFRYLASLANLRMKAEPHALVLSPVPTPGELATKEYKITAAFAEMIARAKGAKEFLTGNAVSFPEGASAVYIRDAQRLIMRNTQENHERVAALIREATPAESPPK